MLKQADGHTVKASSGEGRERGSRDRRSSSSVKGPADREGGLGKKDSTPAIAKGEGGREQKNAAAAGSGKEKVCLHLLSVQKTQTDGDVLTPFHAHTHTNTHTQIHTHKYTHTPIHTHTHTHTHRHVHTHTRTHTHTHTHTHVRTHTCTQ